MKKTIIITGILLAFFVYVQGYGSGRSEDKTMKDKPAWVDKLPTAIDKVYAVGMANLGANPVLSRKKAEDDARQELGKSMSIKVKSVMDKFVQEAQDMINKDNAGSFEVTTYVSQSVSENVVTNSQIVDKWEDKENSIIYVLASMDKTQATTTIKESVQKESAKIFVEEKKDEGIKKLDDELEKWDLSK